MEALLKKISSDIALIKNELYDLREEIDSLRIVKPSYIKKINKIKKKGNFRTYSNVEELRKAIENV